MDTGTRRPPLVSTQVRLAPDDREALRREALRRVEAGEAHRLDSSAIIRELVQAWRGGRS